MKCFFSCVLFFHENLTKFKAVLSKSTEKKNLKRYDTIIISIVSSLFSSKNGGKTNTNGFSRK